MKDLDIIYFAARELPPGDRPAYLAKVCAGDPDLQARVEQMLAVAKEAEAFIADPRPEEEEEGKLGQAADSNKSHQFETDETVGTTIGPYKIMERVGEGGCGVVYVAEQTHPVRRRVALKVIKLGMDTKQVVARFEVERQALAMMDHPNIARVLDAGATEEVSAVRRQRSAARDQESRGGNKPPLASDRWPLTAAPARRPYFVMELVRGIPITDYCDQANLSTKERLNLFIQVCCAIQHAHQKGIIHRDIKPSNILVTLHDGVPVPKVIDFGIAKAIEGRITDATVYTQLHQFIGTPAYMSPEQAEMSGLDIDTRSDIYSLGVLLYELLAGSTPFEAQELLNSGLDMMRKIIREKEPVRPSTRLKTLGVDQLTSTAKRRSTETSKLVHQLSGDLDWIVMKCLEKDRTRRYETAIGLAADLKRHLGAEPVVARPASVAYKFQKAFRRNRIAFTSAAAVVLALLAGTGISTWQAVVATKARKAEVKQRMAAQDAQAMAMALQKKAEAATRMAEEQLKRSEWLTYAGKIMLAETDFEAGNGGLAIHYLEQCQENLRGWEFRHLWDRIQAKQTLSGHQDAVSSVAFSPDGRRLVTGSEDGTAKVWDTETGQEALALEGHHGMVLSVVFSPDGERVATGGGRWGVGKKPGEVKVWDAWTGQLLLDLKGHSYFVWSVAFSPDGQRLVTGAGDWAYSPGETKVWDATTGREIFTLKGYADNVHCVAFSPDGQRMITGSMNGTAKVWEATTGQELLTLKGHKREVTSLAFNSAGDRIVTGCGDKTAKVWDAGTGRELFTLKGHTRRVSSVAFSPDGQRIITGSSDQTTKVWDAVTGEEIYSLKGHEGYVRGVAYSPDGHRIATVSNDKKAKIWNAEKGQEIPALKGHQDSVTSVAFSQDGKRIVTGSGDGTAKVWDTATGREVMTLKVSTNNSWSVVGLWGVAFSPDGNRIVTGSQDKTAKVWDAKTGQVMQVLEHPGVVSCVAYSPDGQRIVTGIGEWGKPGKKPGEAKVWNATTGRELFSLKHTNEVWSVAFSPDGQRIVTGCDDHTAKVWEVATGRELFVLPHSARVWSVAFSPDGRRIATGSWDQTAKVWDAATGEELLTLRGHTDSVRGVAFSPDGQRIVTGSDDWTAKLWDAATGLEVFVLGGHSQMVWSVAFSPDGERILTGISGQDAIAKMWYAPPPSH